MKLKLIFITFLLITTSFLKAQSTRDIDATDLIFECTKYGGKLPSRQLAIWYPIEFWKILGSQLKMPPEATTKMNNEMKNYLMFVVVDYTFSTNGRLIFKSEKEILETLLLIDSSKKIYYPLKEDEISADTKKLQMDLKPVFEKMLGQFGEGMRIVIFSATNTQGENNFNISKKNSFSLKWNSTSLKWKLPFYSALPSKFCPIDNEEMKGNWDFCPEHGEKLK